MSATFAPVHRARRLISAASASLLALAGFAGVGLGIVSTAAPAGAAVTFGQAYWNVASDGGVFAHNAGFYGSEGGRTLNAPVVGGAAYPFFEGYWLAASDGGVFNHGSAGFFGSEGGTKLNAPVVGIAATPTGAGYWLVASDGGVFSHGDAKFFGSEGGSKLNAPIVGIAATPSGKGYWLVASDGGVFTHGDAAFSGSEGGRKLNKPVIGMAATPDGQGYWLAASDGGVFAHGSAGFFGSEGSRVLNAPIVGIGATNSGNGYRLVGRDGGIFTHGDAQFQGSEGGIKLNKPVVAIMTRLPFSVKVDPFAAPAGSADSSSWAPTGNVLTLNESTTESPEVPAGARVLGVEGLSVVQLGTIGFTYVSGTSAFVCDGIRPRFNLYLDSNNDGVGDTTNSSFACPASTPDGTAITFNPAGSINGSWTVVGMDLVQDANGIATLDDIKVAGVTVGTFETVRKAE